ncbi:MAG TPA: transposase [Terriglobia bacterium]|nr:transposase [Terriglobia bacterium]
MKYDSRIHHRRSIRLHGYDYSFPGAYFITICAFNKEFLFGRIVDGQMQLNDWGQIVQTEWFRSGRIRGELKLDMFIVMPNHVHGIVQFVGAGGARPVTVGASGVRPIVKTVGYPPGGNLGARRAPLRMRPRSLASFIAGFKCVVTRRIREISNAPRARVWQRNYYEHVIRNEDELNKIRDYIATNPLRWMLDRENPAAAIPLDDESPWL